ncbi:MAG: hypothetical protein HY744_30780 [Deltaproteobacteria bacterium]|nr:hypothetical protein [Deltaproteobacteria bacterium]
MKTRTSALVLMLSAVLPALLTQAGLPHVPLGPGVAHAQPADARTEQARERFIEGVQAYDAGRFEEARTLFLQAYALKRHPAVLLNLGLSGVKSGHVVEGGTNLQRFLREHTEASPDQIKAAKDGVADARKRIGFVVVIVDTDGAAVAIDGKPVGTSPLTDPVFVEPGEHEVEATLGSKKARVKVDAQKGSATPVTLEISPGAPAPAPPPPAPVKPAPPSSGWAEPVSSPPPPPGPATSQPVGPVATPPAPGPSPALPPDRVAGGPGRENVLTWFKRKPLAWVGVGVTGLGLVGTIAFGAAAADASGAADTVSEQILYEVDHPQSSAGALPPDYYRDGKAEPCGSYDQDEAGAKPAHPYYAKACVQLRDNISAYNTDIALLVTSAVLTGVGAGATVAYYFIDTRAGGTAANHGSHVTTAIVPVIAPSHQGLAIMGRF